MDRRKFIKGAAVLGAAPLFYSPKFLDPGEGRLSFRPHLDPLRVAGIHDPKMTSKVNKIAPWKVQEKLVNPSLIEDNLDRLAMALTQEKVEKDAWKKIFIKPRKKSWSDAIVAIKTNNIARQHTRSPVLAKVCKTMVQVLGVKAQNIFVYDACHGKDMLTKTKFKGLPNGVNISALWGGYNLDTEVAPQWKGKDGKTKCLDHLVKGKIDIMVNIAMCKGHFPPYGCFSMCMKNHLGTFSPKPAHPQPPTPREQATEYLLAINKSPLILGEADKKTKKIHNPIQQLCIVDALWASKDGPMCNSSDQPNRLFMGTFAPAIDYQVARLFRKEVMKWPVHGPILERFLTDFGFDPKDLPNKGEMIQA